MSRRSAVICCACQRAFSRRLAFAASRNRPSRGLRSLGTWMRMAATASRGDSGAAAGTGSSLTRRTIARGVQANLATFLCVIENVVLIDEADAPLAEGEKLDVHREGALH